MSVEDDHEMFDGTTEEEEQPDRTNPDVFDSCSRMQHVVEVGSSLNKNTQLILL